MPEPATPPVRMTLAEYLASEEASPVRREFHDGEVLDMSGGTYNHAKVAGNLIRAAGNRLADTPCSPNTSDLKVATVQANRFVFPDMTIHCGPPEFHDQDPRRTTLINPRVVFEVLSPSTEGYDRGEKFLHYQQIETFEEYVLLAADTPRVESILRQDDGTWNLKSWSGLDAVMQIRCLPLDLPLGELYDGILPEGDAPRSTPGAEA